MTLMNPIRIGLLIPSETQCGVYTYSRFLAKPLAQQNGVSLSLLENPIHPTAENYRRLANEWIQNFDVIHIQFEFARFGKFFVSGVAAPALYNSLWGKIPVVSTIHEIPKSKNPFVKIIQEQILKTVVNNSKIVIVHTDESAMRLRKLYPTQTEKIVVVPHGIEVSNSAVFKPLDQNRVVIGFFGFLSPHKNVEALLDALQSLPDSFVLLVAGGAQNQAGFEYEKKLRRLCMEKGLQSRVEWMGFVPDELVDDVFSKMDFVVFPYKSVTESGALHLALGRRKIVFASNLVPFVELSQKSGCVEIFSNSAELADQLLGFVQNPAKRMDQEQKIDLFLQSRSWPIIAQLHAAILQKATMQ